MLHSIPEICDLVTKGRSEIYAMLNNGEMSYVIGQDGKRKVDASELQRVFPDLTTEVLSGNTESKSITPTADKTVIKKVGKERKSITLSQEKEASIERQQTQSQELYELRGMITDLRNEIDNVLDDNRRLLRLLEYQTMRDEPPLSSESQRTASTDMAKQGWKNYQKTREEEKESGSQTSEPSTEHPSNTSKSKIHYEFVSSENTAPKETNWIETLKRFFLQY